jgi:hypothetical protein
MKKFQVVLSNYATTRYEQVLAVEAEDGQTAERQARLLALKNPDNWRPDKDGEEFEAEVYVEQIKELP